VTLEPAPKIEADRSNPGAGIDILVVDLHVELLAPRTRARPRQFDAIRCRARPDRQSPLAVTDRIERPLSP